MPGLKEFQEKVAADEAFAAKFADAKELEDVVALAAKEGFTFTVEDVKGATELSDDDLANVAGGGAFIMAKHYFVIRR
jgi:predicted ribosomally synthesized peptide with nif11-like leader